MLELARRLLRLLGDDRRGVTAMEYGLIAALIVVAVIGGLTKVTMGLLGLVPLYNALH